MPVRTFCRAWFFLLPLFAAQALCVLETRAFAQLSNQPTRAAKSAPPPAPALAGLDESKGCIVPFTYDPPVHPFIVVQVRINKSRPLPFVVSTGAETVVTLMPWAAQELKLPTAKVAPQAEGAAAIPQRVTAGIQVNIVTRPGPIIDFNTDTAYVSASPVLENAATPRIAGVIGIGLFRVTTGRFDFDAKTLTIFADKHLPLTPAPPAVSLPILMPLPALPTLPQNSLMAPVSLSLQAGKSTMFEIDTSNTNTIVPAGDGMGLPHLLEATTNIEDATGNHALSELLLPSLPLGGAAAPLAAVSLNPQATHGILGLDVLTRFRVTLDVRNGFVTLEPRSGFHEFLTGATDISLEFRDGGVYLGQVLRLTDNPNIMSGDRLLSIDGVETSGQGYIEAYLRLNGTAGTTALLALEKPDHRKVTVPWLRRSDFPLVAVSPVGLLMTKEDKQAARVLAVLPGSEAQVAGLQAGDEVTTVDGAAVEPMTFNVLQGLFAADEHGGVNVHRFTVKRDKADAVLAFQLEKGTLHKS